MFGVIPRIVNKQFDGNYTKTENLNTYTQYVTIVVPTYYEKGTKYKISQRKKCTA